jgi:hypothetical protein
MRQLGLGIIVAIGLTLPALGQEAVDPEEGTYVFNPAKSSIRGPVSKAEILNVGKQTNTAVGFDADGKSYSGSFPNAGNTADGQSRSVPGNPFFDSVTTTRVDQYTIKTVRTKDGKVVSILTRMWNPSTKTLTTTAIGTNAAGQSYSHVLVYEKQ